MKLFDCHLHSSFSFDSSQDIEEYAKRAVAGDGAFITTEHMDLESHYDNMQDVCADFDRLQNRLKELEKKYGIKALMGVEAGWRRDIRGRVRQVIKSYPFDMVILSVHECAYCDVSFPEFRQGKTVDECYNEYLDLIYDAVCDFDDFDTLGHIDYVLRYAGHTDMSRHREKLTRIFEKLMEKDKALEINVKMFPEKDSVERAEYILMLYTSLGGKKVTLGSDAHMIKWHKNCFDSALQMIKANGIGQVYTFEKRQPVPVKIEL